MDSHYNRLPPNPTYHTVGENPSKKVSLGNISSHWGAPKLGDTNPNNFEIQFESLWAIFDHCDIVSQEFVGNQKCEKIKCIPKTS